MSDVNLNITANRAQRQNRCIFLPQPMTVTYHGASAMSGLDNSPWKELVAARRGRSALVADRRLPFVDSIKEPLIVSLKD